MVSQYEHGPDFQTPNEAEIAEQAATITALRDRVAAAKRERDHYKSDLQTLASTFYKEDQHQDYAKHILDTALTADAAEAQVAQMREGERIADAVLDWMVKHDLLDADNEYYASDVLAVLNDLAPAEHSAAIAAAEARATAAEAAIARLRDEVIEEALDRAAREGYAVRCKTNGPRVLAEYASRDIMDKQLADARVIVSAYLAALRALNRDTHHETR